MVKQESTPEKAGVSDEQDRMTMPVDHESEPRLRFPVVGIGASAGGLEAFMELFSAMPADSGMAFVLVQHLPPERESLVAEILSHRTQMPVLQVEDGMTVEPNHVYVIRPGRTMTIDRGVLHLGESVDKPANRRPVDDFFRSLAQEQRERAICVIMSGMGSNGTAGAQAVKAVGGMCIAQDPDLAKFSSMPRSVIEAGYADFILQPPEIPELLIRYAQHPYTNGETRKLSSSARERHVLTEILSVLRTRVRLDFTGYKKPTVIGRIQRRMGLHQITVMDDYARLLRQNPGEVTALADDLMIHVTGFFRDPEVWESLREKVIVPLITERAEDTPIRAWVTACSSGEEAYTLGMLLIETAEAARKNFEIKIFATDTAERSLAHARSGTFPGGIESEISLARLERFFERDDSQYRVKKELRELVVFAPQNVLQDPPFSRLDICTCRNFLIYLESDVQQRALSLMHFGLREGGTLLLGTSETISGAEELYEPIDKRLRIFRRLGPTRHGAFEFPVSRSGAPRETDRSPGYAGPRTGLAPLTQSALLERFTPPAVVIDRQQRIVYFHGRTERYLDQPQGEPTREIVSLAREFVRGAVRTAVQKALSENTAVTVRDGIIETPEGRWRVEVSVTALEARPPHTHFLVAFAEIPEPSPSRTLQADADVPEHYRSMGEELARVRDELQSTIEELQTSNEEMKASNEEVTSVNEELQSTNEELETSKEELQSLNEELSTVNAQLQVKMEELEGTTNDLSSLLSSTNIAVVFLDRTYRIRRFTPAVRDLFELLPADIGRPLNDLARKFVDADLMRDAHTVLDSLVPREAEITSDTGRIYLRRLLPYRTVDNRIDGLVITFVDIGERKHAQAELKLSQERNTLILDTIKEYAIFMLDDCGKIMTWTKGAERTFGYSMSEALGQPLDLIFTAEDRASGLASLELKLASSTGSAQEDRWHQRKDGTRFWGTGALYGLKNDNGQTGGFVKVLRDNTDRKHAEETMMEIQRAAEQANEAKDHFLANVSHELRTPLTAMLLWVKLLMEGETPVPDAMKEGLEAIKRCADEQQELIEDLVDTSRIVAGKLRLELKVTDLLATVRAALDAVRPATHAKDIVVKEYHDEDIGLVHADPHRLQQVVWNLLTNAVKFTPEGGRVDVAVRRMDDNVIIQVTDSGQGISQKVLPHVFERFHQADNSTTRTNSGLGLGLAISKQLVEMHGGTIVADSAGVDQGATFTVTLPLPKVATPANVGNDSSSPLPPIEDLAGRHILLVEDSAETRKAVSALLRSAGAEVTVTGSAAEAMEEFDRRRPDILLSDIGLPTTDGHEFIQQIRRKEAAAGRSPTPALALTAFADEKNRRKAIKSGFQKCLTKPVNPAKLISALAKLNRSD